MCEMNVAKDHLLMKEKTNKLLFSKLIYIPTKWICNFEFGILNQRGYISDQTCDSRDKTPM